MADGRRPYYLLQRRCSWWHHLQRRQQYHLYRYRTPRYSRNIKDNMLRLVVVLQITNSPLVVILLRRIYVGIGTKEKFQILEIWNFSTSKMTECMPGKFPHPKRHSWISDFVVFCGWDIVIAAKIRREKHMHNRESVQKRNGYYTWHMLLGLSVVRLSVCLSVCVD